jgi:hypothetical protein
MMKVKVPKAMQINEPPCAVLSFIRLFVLIFEPALEIETKVSKRIVARTCQ